MIVGENFGEAGEERGLVKAPNFERFKRIALN